MLKNLRLIALITTMLIAVLAVAVAPASAGKPIVYREEVDIDEWAGLNCSGFDVFWRYEGFLVWHIFEDRIVVIYHIDVTYYAVPDTGKTLSGRSYGPNIIDFEEGAIAMMGLFFRAKTPEGNLVLDAGKIVFDLDTMEVIEAHGPHAISDEALGDQLCSLLAP